MAVASTKQYDCSRDGAENTWLSINLKADNNLQEYVVIIVGIRDNHYLFENLPRIISKDRVILFNDPETSLEFIHSLHNTDIFLIISGKLGEAYARKFVCMSQIIGLYIYCMDEDKHKIWTKGIEKIRCTVSDATQLLIRLYANIKELSGRWPLGEKSFQKASTPTSQWYHLFLLVICYRSQSIEKSYHEMFEECRAYYRTNTSMIGKIDQLERMYKPDDAIREYTQDSFLYRIVNHALRTQNMETVRKFSPFIRDLHFQLHDYHRKYYHSNEHYIRAVYRGQYLSLDELEYLRLVCKSRNPVITLTTFTSASLDPEVALTFALPMDNRLSCIFEIIITDEYDKEHKYRSSHEQAFANISSLSFKPDEQEVLFSLVTHFRVKYVGSPVNQIDFPWVPIVLELARDNQGKCDSNHFSIIDRIEKDTNPQSYADTLHLLEVNATDELKFNNTNWQKWWNRLTKKLEIDPARDQPLLLTLYDCFTEDNYRSRKAVEMYKDILRSIPEIESNLSSFSYLFHKFKIWQETPTKRIALYEKYLKKFCTTNTEEVIQCLWSAGQTYEIIADMECALECYQKVFDIDVDDKYQMKNKIQNRMKILKNPSKSIRTMKDKREAVSNNTDKDFSQMYEAQEEQWSIYWAGKGSAIDKPSIETRLARLLNYLIQRERWYDAADSKIVLRLPFENTEDLSINDYQSYFSSSIKRHTSSSSLTTDATNNHSLSLWRYEKYMREWALFKELENFLNPFQEKSKFIRLQILPRLDQLMKKLSLLITLCAVYVCMEQSSGQINVNNVQSINETNTKTTQLVFFDLTDSDLLAGLEALEEQSSVIDVSPIIIPDHIRMLM